jgi:lipoyl(octanoyl) transferase
VDDKKIASLGVGIKKWITMHGFALNVLTSCLPAFSQITPCGIVGVQMTSLETESPEPVTLPDVTARAAGMFAEL